MFKLYAGVRSRASIVQWYLEELNVPYEVVTLDLQAGEQLQPSYRKINPFGKVPGIVDGATKLWESGAILLYLEEKYGKAPFEERIISAQWVVFANATLGPGVFVEANRDRELPRLMKPLNELFERQDFVSGDHFTVADVAVGSMLAYIPIMLQLDLSDYPAVVDYTKRMGERPAFQKAIGGRK